MENEEVQNDDVTINIDVIMKDGFTMDNDVTIQIKYKNTNYNIILIHYHIIILYEYKKYIM